MDTTALEELGLTPTEIKIYLCLLRLGPSKAGQIVKATGLQNSVVHLTLGKLHKTGMISYSKSSQVKLYQANDPKYLLNLADEKRKRLEKIIPKLASLREEFDLPEAEIYQGMTGLKNMCYKLIEDAEKNDEFLFFAFNSTNVSYLKQVYDFYREYTDTRSERGIVIKGIASANTKQSFKENNWPHDNIQFVNFPIIQSTVSFVIKLFSFPGKNLRQVFYLIQNP